MTKTVGLRALGLALTLMIVATQVIAGTTALPGPLVQGDWLKANKDSPALVLLDIQEPQAFMRHHVPGSVNWPFSQWRTGDNAVPPKSLPPLEDLAKRLGEAGIAADSPIVIIATGTSSSDLSASARVFWTLKVLGHEQAAVLDGGLAGYVNEHRGAFESGPRQVQRTPVTYSAEPNLDLLADAQWLQSSDMPRLDARSLGEFVGVIAGPGERPGTLPDAHHLPFDWLAEGSGGRLRDRAALDRLFEHAGVGGQAAVHFCHTGNRAALTWFVDYAVMGNDEARLYDASMIEWGKDNALPIETRLDM
jgi:thiosulfate/3-mercaptopyruvate sulfurtransferase